MKEHEIVFEGLHGEPEKDSATVDLDADNKESGVERFSVEGDDDDARIVDLGEGKKPDDDKDDGKGKKAGDDKDDDDPYSKKVKARISRESRRAATEKERADFWEQQARDARKKISDQQKRDAKQVIERSDNEIKSIEEQLEKAHEDGESKVVVRLTSKLTDLKAEKIQAGYLLEQADDGDDEIVFTPSGEKAGDRGRVQPSSEKDDLVAGWMDDNNDWYGRKGFEKYTRATNRIDKEVFEDGFDPGTAEYYEELSARVKEKFPDIFDDDTGKDRSGDTASTRRKTSTVAPVGGPESSSTKQSSSSRVELDEQDFENMRRFNLDTNDPEVLKEYARNKREAEQSATRQ